MTISVIKGDKFDNLIEIIDITFLNLVFFSLLTGILPRKVFGIYHLTFKTKSKHQNYHFLAHILPMIAFSAIAQMDASSLMKNPICNFSTVLACSMTIKKTQIEVAVLIFMDLMFKSFSIDCVLHNVLVNLKDKFVVP